MSTLPAFRRIFKNDYAPESQNLVQQLSVTINNGLETLYNAFNKKIGLTDNLFVTVKTIIVRVDANGIPIADSSFTIDISSQIQGLSIIKAENLSNTNDYTTYILSHPFIAFTQQTKTIIINKITGLYPNQDYRLKVIAWG